MEMVMIISVRMDVIIVLEVVSDDSICFVYFYFVCGEKEFSN